MPVGIENINLRKPRHSLRIDDHPFQIHAVGVFPVALRPQKPHRVPVIPHPYREMNIARIDPLRSAKSRMLASDQVQLLRLSNLEPGPWEREGRPLNFPELQDLAIEPPRPLQIAGGQTHMVECMNIHASQPSRHADRALLPRWQALIATISRL